MPSPQYRGEFDKNGAITVTKAKKRSANFVEYANGEKSKNVL